MRRTYEYISGADRPATVAFYLEGVGDPRHPITGLAFGKGMNNRIESMYAELIKIYQPRDRIYVYGFSRGTLMARAFAGLISYAGVPELDTKPRAPDDYTRIAEQINDHVKTVEERDYRQQWLSWTPGKSAPVLATFLKEAGIPWTLQPVRIEFVGVWDAVPGSARKTYSDCMEDFGGSEGTRYKTNSYPTIRRLAHAASIDEKRDRFQLLRVCNPINPSHTTVVERFFPGSHSDVGGGYENGHSDLPDISLKWMYGELLLTSYPLATAATKDLNPKPDGIAHWSRAGLVNVLMNECQDRQWRTAPSDVPQPQIDESYDKRIAAAHVPLLVGDAPVAQQRRTPYPMSCAEYNRIF